MTEVELIENFYIKKNENTHIVTKLSEIAGLRARRVCYRPPTLSLSPT